MDNRELSRRSVLAGAALAGSSLALGAPAMADEGFGKPKKGPDPLASTYQGRDYTAVMQHAFPVVETQWGKVRGLEYGGIACFRGIPFGASTGGKNRFMPPLPPAPWSGIRDAFGFADGSPQETQSAKSEYVQLIEWDQPRGGMSEDCLALNVWSPGVGSGKRPVFVSFHGGGWTSGSGAGAGYWGDPLARFGDAVVVTVNHRLGALGYLHLADLGAPPEFAMAGVAGALDMVAALNWVKNNIAMFGGDPGNIMIYGQSGGGAKTSTLMAVPSAKGLFHRAAVQSGSAIRLSSRQEASRTAALLMKTLGLGARDFGKLQSMPFVPILAAQIAVSDRASWQPVVDGRFLPEHPFDPGAPAYSADVPLIVSTTLDDAALRLVNFDLDDAGLKRIAENLAPGRGVAVHDAYRAAYPSTSPYLVQARMITDKQVRSRANLQAERKFAQHGAPVWMYRFDMPCPSLGGKFGAVHGTDVGLTFHNPMSSLTAGATADFARLADQMAGSWVAFARTGDPNHTGLPSWPSFDPERRATLLLNVDSHSENDPDGELRKLWMDVSA